MRRLILVAMAAAMLVGCSRDAKDKSRNGRAGAAAVGKAASTRLAGPVRVAKWTTGAVPSDEVNVIAMGDWGNGKDRQRDVAKAMAGYLTGQNKQFNGVLSVGDNFYVSLRGGANDPNWQKVFEDMYDSQRINMPFYAVLGNHDYGSGRENAELAYAREHPDSRWKMPTKWYRLELPENKPLVTVLMLDSNKGTMKKEEWAGQLKWLEAELARPRTTRWLVCGAHHPIFSDGDHGDTAVIEKEWGPLFKKHKVDFYLCGHDHSLQHLEVGGWPMSFVVAGGGGQARTDMKRDDRGPFQRKLYGFTHLQFRAETARVKYINGLDQKVVHEFTRGTAGKVAVVSTTPNDKAKGIAATATALVRGLNSAAGKAIAARGDDYQQMAKIFDMSPAQKTAFEKKLADRKAGYAAWDQTERGREFAALTKAVAEAKTAKDAAKLAELEPQLAAVTAERTAMRTEMRRQFNEVLTPAQLRRWAGQSLYNKVLVRLKDAGMNDAQKEQSHAICCLLAADTVNEANLKANPYCLPDARLIEKAAKAVGEHVLEEAQRKKAKISGELIGWRGVYGENAPLVVRHA